MLNQRTIKLVLILSVIFVNIGCDQVSKKFVRSNVASNAQITLFRDHLTVTKVENTGAFLSMGNTLPATAKNILLSALPLGVLAFIFGYALRKKIPAVPLTGICFIIGGGIGNLFDRILYGSVTDFLHIDFGLFRTGIFNMADVSIVTGTLLILFYSLLKRRPAASTDLP